MSRSSRCWTDRQSLGHQGGTCPRDVPGHAKNPRAYIAPKMTGQDLGHVWDKPSPPLGGRVHMGSPSETPSPAEAIGRARCARSEEERRWLKKGTWTTMRRKDSVTDEVRRFVLKRDGACVASILDPSHVCRDQWGRPHKADLLGAMTLDHVKTEPMMGKRAPSDADHLVTLCWGAHIRSAWATSHRPELRDYLKAVR